MGEDLNKRGESQYFMLTSLLGEGGGGGGGGRGGCNSLKWLVFPKFYLIEEKGWQQCGVSQGKYLKNGI